MRLRSRVAAAFIAFVCTLALAAQQSPAPIERVHAAALESWPQVGLDITVTDSNDAPVKGLSLEQLTIKDNGHAVTGASLAALETVPQSVCLVVDTSGSTYESRNAITSELKQIMGGLPSQDEVCAISFSAEAFLDIPFTTNRAPFAKWIGFLRSSGGSALIDALNAASMEMQSNARYPDRAIILISDGGENASRFSEADLVKTLHTLGAPTLYALVNRTHDGEPSRRDSQRLLSMTRETGGLELSLARPQDLQAGIDLLLRSLAGRYRLVFTPADSAADGKQHVLDVQLAKDLRKQKMNVGAPRGYDAARQ